MPALRHADRARRLRGAHDLLLPRRADRRPRAQGPAAVEAAALIVERVREAGDELVEALARLLPQLSSSAAAPSRAHLTALVASESTALFVARDDVGRIVGTLTLAAYRTPAGFPAWIEDVVVDEAARGTGAGRALVEVALAAAGEWGVASVNLTSRPSREAANGLYRALGFERRETNVYRWRP